MARTIMIGRKSIGAGCPTFVIAEVGCNHENDFDRAREMVLKAAEAGADAVKFQSFNPDTLVTRDAPKFWDLPGPGSTQYEEFVDAQPRFSRQQYQELMAVAERSGVLFFSTPSDEAWTDFLDELGVPLFKIASMDITHLPLLRHVARKRKPVILSTGASHLEEVREAVEVVRQEGNEDIVLLHCISTYPTLPSGVHLRMMHHVAKEFPTCVVGYSDHTVPSTSLSVPTLAVAAGAQVVEKHFTFDSSRPGYDHAISADYTTFKTMVHECREVERVLGRSSKTSTAPEGRTRQWGRRSIVAAVPIGRGARILPEMLAIKRPGTGIEPKCLTQVLGKRARQDIDQDQLLRWELLE